MQEQRRTYIAIDLKSFYASVECVDRGLDPLTTNLVVADESRTEKTICLAVTPSLKAYGIGGRARLFEVYQKARGVDFIIAKPRMAHYIDVSTKIYGIYLKYIAPEDIHVYSIDEVFMDVTPYLKSYKMTAHQLGMTIIRDVLAQTGITATAGIGTNMYLCKVAMDIVAKKMPADKDGVRIAELFDHYVNPDLLIRRLNLTTNHVVAESSVHEKSAPQQLDLFTDYALSELVKYVMEDTGCTIEQAMERVYNSPLMTAIQNEEGELYVQSPAYLYELLNIAEY